MFRKTNGQINVVTAIIAAGGMILASAFTGWFSASTRTGIAETRISVVEERKAAQQQALTEKLQIAVGEIIDANGTVKLP